MRVLFIDTSAVVFAFFDQVDTAPNLARTLVDKVRRRKGLHVEEKLVQSATKQRTLSKKA
jgi:ribosome assembly protein 1